MLIKHKIKRDFNNKFIKISLSNTNNILFDEDNYVDFINLHIENNVNPIEDGDTTIYKLDGFTIIDFDMNTSLVYDSNDIIAKKSFFIIDFYAKPETKSNLLFRGYINGLSEDMIYMYNNTPDYKDLYIFIPNNISGDEFYCQFKLFYSGDGKLYPFKINNTPVENENQLFLKIIVDRVNKTFEFENSNNVLYEIVGNNTFVGKLQTKVDTLETKKPSFKDGNSFIINGNIIKFDNL